DSATTSPSALLRSDDRMIVGCEPARRFVDAEASIAAWHGGCVRAGDGAGAVNGGSGAPTTGLGGKRGGRGEGDGKALYQDPSPAGVANCSNAREPNRAGQRYIKNRPYAKVHASDFSDLR